MKASIAFVLVCVVVNLPEVVWSMALPENANGQDQSSSFYDVIYRPYHGLGRQWFLYGKTNNGNNPMVYNNRAKMNYMPTNTEMVETLFKNLLKDGPNSNLQYLNRRKK